MQEAWTNIVESVGAYTPQLVGALAVLVVGWLVALIVAAGVRGGLRRTKLDARLAKWMFGEGAETRAPRVVGGVGKGVFWLIMFLVLVAFFQTLGLTLATDPLNRLLNQVFAFIPQLLGAGVLLLIAWIIGSVLRLLIVRGLGAAKLDERLRDEASEGKEPGVSLVKTIGDAAYWLVFLVFLPAILGALEVEGLLGPVQQMLDKFLSFLPNLLAAGVIVVIGWFVARMVQRIVVNLLAAAGADQFGERVGLVAISGIVGLIVYILILIPVLVAALNALALDAITNPTSHMLDLILGAIPSIFAAGVLVTIAYVVGKVVFRLIADLLTRIGFNSIFVRLGVGREPKEGERTASEWVGYLTWLAIMLVAVFEASGLLGFEVLSDLMASVAIIGGHILLGIVILGIGLYLANLAARTIQSSDTAQAGLLSGVARVGILLVTGSIALSQMGLADEIINLAFGLMLGAIAVAMAIAFGIGGRDMAARKLAEWTKSSRKDLN